MEEDVKGVLGPFPALCIEISTRYMCLQSQSSHVFNLCTVGM